MHVLVTVSDVVLVQVKLYSEKRAELEEQQHHLNVGLRKIRETVEQVEELQKSLSIKRNELEEKNNLANAKLKQMVKDQQEAERKKVTSQEIQHALEEQNKVIALKKETVRADLAQVEPAVIEAQQGTPHTPGFHHSLSSVGSQQVDLFTDGAMFMPACKSRASVVCWLLLFLFVHVYWQCKITFCPYLYPLNAAIV